MNILFRVDKNRTKLRNAGGVVGIYDVSSWLLLSAVVGPGTLLGALMSVAASAS